MTPHQKTPADVDVTLPEHGAPALDVVSAGVPPHQETPYTRLADAMRDLDAEIVKGEPRYALTSRLGGPFQWEQVGGRPRKPAFNMDRIHAAVAKRLTTGL